MLSWFIFFITVVTFLPEYKTKIENDIVTSYSNMTSLTIDFPPTGRQVVGGK